jgi:hypothetical protein
MYPMNELLEMGASSDLISIVHPNCSTAWSGMMPMQQMDVGEAPRDIERAKHRTTGCKPASDKGWTVQTHIWQASDGPHFLQTPARFFHRSPATSCWPWRCALIAQRQHIEFSSGSGSGTRSSLSGGCSAMSQDDDAISIHLCLLSLRPYGSCFSMGIVNV